MQQDELNASSEEDYSALEADECLNADALLNLTDREGAARAILHNDGGTALITYILPTFMVFGVSANLSFLYVVYRRRAMRTITNAYLANLALADIFFLISATVPAQVQYYSSPVVFDQLTIGTEGCTIVNFLIFLFFYASTFLVFLVSFERYGAICRPLHQRVVMGRTRTIKLIIGTWTVALVFSSLAIPAFLNMHMTCIIWPEGLEDFQDLPTVVGICTPVAPWVTYVFNGVKMAPFVAAMFSSGYIYTKIIIQLNKKIPGLANKRRCNSAMSRVLRSRRQIAVMLIATGVIFFVCQSVAQVNTLAVMITNATESRVLNDGQRAIVQWVGRMLLFINSAVNPIIYNVTNSRYRDAFKETFRCNKRKKITLQRSTVKSMYIPTENNHSHWNNNYSIELDKL